MTYRKKWFIRPVILLVIILFVLIIGKITQESFAVDKKDISVKVNSEQIEKGIKLLTETKDSDSFTSFMAIPFSKIEELDQPINYWAIEQEEIFYDQLEKTKLFVDEDITAHFNLHTDIYKINDHIYNFALTVEHFLQNERNYSQVKTYMIDLQTGSFLAFSEVFNKEKIVPKKLWKLIDDNLKEDINESEFKETVSNMDEVNWIVQNESLVIYMNPTDVKQIHETIAVEVPLIKIYQYIKEPYKETLISDNLAEEIKQIEKKEARKKLQLDPNGKYVALTFDDGPHDKVTQQILESLKTYDAKATFFMLSNNVKYYPDLAKQVVNEGHEIANHSETHVNLNAVNKKRMDKEVKNSKSIIEKFTGISPSIFRPPYGEYNETVVTYAEASDQSIILWSVDTLDWKSRNAKAIYNAAINKTRPGAIVLMHDIHQPTADALPLILKELSNQGYEFVTVSELLTILDDEGIGPYFGN